MTKTVVLSILFFNGYLAWVLPCLAPVLLFIYTGVRYGWLEWIRRRKKKVTTQDMNIQEHIVMELTAIKKTNKITNVVVKHGSKVLLLLLVFAVGYIAGYNQHQKALKEWQQSWDVYQKEHEAYQSRHLKQEKINYAP